MKEGIKMMKVAFALISMLVFVPFASAEPGTIDQEQWTVTNALEFDSNYWLAQSFTPTQGYLTAVESLFYPYYSGAGPYTVEIWACSPSLGADPRLGSAPIATKTVTNIDPYNYVLWQFDTPINVTSYLVNSESLLILWKTSISYQAMYIANNNPYPNGKVYRISDTGNTTWTWAANGSYDMFFRTYGMPYTAQYCGDVGTTYNVADLNKDCKVDFKDFALMAENWMKCSDPANINCDIYWLQ
jgi:hypothetical protein